MRIGLDFDGVVTDCGQLKSDGAKRLYGVEISPDKFKKELVIGAGILTSEQYREVQRQIYETRELGMLMKVVEGAPEYIRKLQQEGHDLSIKTSRNKIGVEIAEEYLSGLKLKLPIVGVGGGVSKADACRGLDVYVDDDLDKLEPLVGIVPYRFLFSWGYNQHIHVAPQVAQRISSWKGLYEKIILLQHR